MATTSRVAIFDSSGLVSLLKSDDELHRDAVQVGEVVAEGWHLLIPYEVYAETINVFGKKVSRAAAVLAGKAIIKRHADQELTLTGTGPHILERALTLQQNGKGTPSFIDCLVMALADEYNTPYIFGFDATFKKNGYQLPTSDTDEERAA